MLDNKFIWGVDFDHPNYPTSFNTWNHAQIIFNRKRECYYLEIDKLNPWSELERLVEIKNAFRDFLLEKAIPLNIEKELGINDINFKADSLSELYVKLNILLEGYEFYYNHRAK